MTLEEARAVATIAETADGGCGTCVSSLCEQLQEAFPQFTWTYSEKTATSSYEPNIVVSDVALMGPTDD